MKSALIVASSVALLACPADLFAHALGVECRLRQGKVEVEAYYSDDTPAPGAEVSVRDEKDKEIAAGQTDREGRWSFAAPPPGKYQVVVEAGAGHRARTQITIPVSAADALRISAGPPRGDFTRFPWLKLMIGIGAIAFFGIAFWLGFTIQLIVAEVWINYTRGGIAGIAAASGAYRAPTVREG